MNLFNQLESQYGLPSGLLDAVWAQESSRGKNMLSPKGAKGHMGFMDATAQQYGVADPDNLTQAATGAARMYSDLLRQYGGDLPRALAGYNWGQGNLARKGFDAAPAETRNYIQKVTAGMGQPQSHVPHQDAASAEWAALNAQFAPGAKQDVREPDPWTELGTKFAQPSQPVAPRAREALSDSNSPPQPSSGLARRAQIAVIPLVGPALAALDINPDLPAIGKGIASGFADLGNTLMNRMTKVGTDVLPTNPDVQYLIDPRLRRPAAGVANLVMGEKPMSQAERENAARAASLEDFNRGNASPWFSGGRLAGNIAGTYPMGGALAAPLRAFPALAPIAEAVATGGFRTGAAPVGLAGRVGNVALRAAGGAATGGAAAGLVNPDDAAAGAMIGGVLPPALQGVNKAGDLAGRAYRALAVSPTTAAARSVLDVGGFATPAQIAEVQAALRAQGPAIVGEGPTVSQILQNPEISQLERTVRNTPGGAPALIARDQAQNAARLTVLNDIAPVAADLPAARTNFGNTIAPRAADARNAASKTVRQAFDAVDPLNDTQFYLPLPEMEAAKAKFLGPGTFGTGSKAQSAIDTATGVGTEMLPRTSLTGSDTVRKTVPFQTVQNLRSSIGEAAEQARMRGANKEAAALDSMKADIDNRVNLVAAGKGDAAENFPVDIVAQWRKAIDLHADKQDRFARGPQAGMFRKGGDGNYAVEGGELAPKFFSPRLSQSEDIEALKRMRLGTPVTDSLKSYATTDASQRVTGDGTLRSKAFNDWLNAHGGAVRGLFDDGERARLTGVGVDLKRASDARDLGRATGSNTSQNVQSALGLGMLDSRAVNLLASRTPFVGKFTGPMLDALRESAKRGKAGRLGGLLSDPAELDRAIADYLSQSVRGPGLLGHDSQTVPFLLRSSPLLASDRS